MFHDEDETYPFVRQKQKKYFDRVFTGYKYSIEYLWRKFLGAGFSRAPVKNLSTCQDWKTLDSYFDKIKQGVIQPIESKVGDTTGFNSLLIMGDYSKSALEELIKPRFPETNLAKKDEVDRVFLWYPIHLIDGSDSDFSGVASFIPLLLGSVQLKQRNKSTEKVSVIRLIHGSSRDERRDYSYAILIELFGAISDASGWILFYNCCSDGGATSLGYRMAEKYIHKYDRTERLCVNTITIAKEEFLTMMNQRMESLTKEQLWNLTKNES
jgi:hypothetical protein